MYQTERDKVMMRGQGDTDVLCCDKREDTTPSLSNDAEDDDDDDSRLIRCTF